MSKLIIVESPSKIKSIKKYLGSGYQVMASKGHVRDLPKSKIGVDFEHDFEPKYMNMADKKEVITELRAAAKKADKVYLATDPDREGEAISWHLAHLLGLDPADKNRVCFNEITKSGVTAGMKQPRALDMNLVDAQQARRVLDRIVGYELSPFLWKKVKRGLSAGRVQSVALRLIVDREREIEAFKPEEYWTVDGTFLKDEKAFTAHFYGTAAGKKLALQNGEQTSKVVAELKTADFRVATVKEKQKRVQPAPPFTTSTLQQEAARKLNFTGQRTMMVAQQLYEGVELEGLGVTGLITYMRTDSLRISEEARAAAASYITNTYGQNYLPEKPRYFKSKASAQDAHEAIRPTMIDLSPEQVKGALNRDQFALYRLIWSRFIASLMAVSLYEVTTVEISSQNYLFKASATKQVFNGYTVLYQEGRDDDEDEKTDALPPLSEGDAVAPRDFEPKQHFTQPPARYSEPTLIKALDENGIGRPSTYAPIISNILNRAYIERQQKALVPTPLGKVITDLMQDYFEKIVDVKFTAGMEESLDKVEKGTLPWKTIIAGFYTDFENDLHAAETALEGKRIKVPEVETDEKCELCGRNLVVRSGRFGKFLACPGFPECSFTKPLPENEVKEPCPKCGAKLLKRRSKKGKTFYACSAYPACDFAAPGIPTGEVCPECGSYLVKGLRGRTYCLNAECPTRKEAAKKTKVAKTKTAAKGKKSSKASTKK